MVTVTLGCRKGKPGARASDAPGDQGQAWTIRDGSARRKERRPPPESTGRAWGVRRGTQGSTQTRPLPARGSARRRTGQGASVATHAAYSP